ncbi:MAG: class C sortase, partial [Oscillospiraceae bacterium]|nr:class C sortase [Oscillospiraceae bacterium]
MKRKVKPADAFITLFFVLVMLIGIAAILYPYFSSWWNDRTQTKIIELYDQSVGRLDTSAKNKILARAQAYNTALENLPDPMKQYEEVRGYDSILDVTGTGSMGYIDIPKISVHLPIY